MSQFISLTQAVDLTTRFRDNRDSVLAQQFQGQDILPKCETVSRDLIDELLAQNDCTGIRIYYGMSQDNKLHAILVGVDGNDADILTAGDPKIIEDSRRCPTDCPPSSDLNDE